MEMLIAEIRVGIARVSDTFHLATEQQNAARRIVGLLGSRGKAWAMSAPGGSGDSATSTQGSTRCSIPPWSV
jgi:hypothetical protein